MPELIHTFTGGKMNKDLDERLLPNGEYRDALNLEVASSDTSQVGTFQNLKGNTEKSYSNYNSNTGKTTTWAPAVYIDALPNAICIGSIAEPNSDMVYWFITSDTNDAIVSYNTITQVTLPLIVDTQDIFNFSADNLITGINILEGILLWTDNQTEPKQIYISEWVGSTPNFITHSQIYNRNFIESDTTVIKKFPLQPPTITAYSTAAVDTNGNPAVVTTSTLYSFYFQAPGGTAGQGTPMTPASGPQTLQWQGNVLPSYRSGQILLLVSASADALDPNATIRVSIDSMLGTFGQQTGAKVTVLSVGPSDDGELNTQTLYNVALEQEKPFFEFRFARFGYRYKYKNNEVSAYSPFTNPAFIPGAFNYSPKEGYNLGMVNNIRQLEISDFIPTNIPVDVTSVDILYKASNNANVYVVDTFKKTDSEWTSNTFNISTEIITSVVQSNQLLRPYDNVPRYALGQEVVANRLIFANYTQNFNMLTSTLEPLQVNLNVSTRSQEILTIDDVGVTQGVGIDGNRVYPSLKSIRTYQIGVAYQDEYGRTTPVFTGKDASVVIEKGEAQFANSITAQLINTEPYYAQNKLFSTFKYYVKETSQEYYNICLDRFYDAEDGNVWLSFPSAERNKIDEETFITLKKEHDNDNPVTEEARYKVIAIENEAPQYLKETRLSKGRAVGWEFAAGFPIEGANEVWFDSAKKFDEDFGEITRTQSGIQLRILTANSTSEWYKISSFGLAGSGTDLANQQVRIICSSSFGSDMNFTSTEPYGFSNKVSGLTLELAEIQTLNKPEFTGRFFVKVNQDSLLESKITNAGADASTSYLRKALGYTYLLTGNKRSGSFWGQGAVGGNNWTKLDAQGSNERFYISAVSTECTKGNFAGASSVALGGTGTPGKLRVGWSGGYGTGRQEGLAISNPALLTQLNTNGSLFRFVDAGNGKSDPNGTIYRITNTVQRQITNYDCKNTSSSWDNYENTTNQTTFWVLDIEPIQGNLFGLQWDPTDQVDGSGIDEWTAASSASSDSYIGMEFLGLDSSNDSFSSSNPAVFETEPKEAAELDIYYEVAGNYLMSEHGDPHELDWFNCYSFGNGVESDRIRDDYNATTMSNGVKASATLDEPYEQETRSNGLIFSQIFNSTSGINGLNQFIQAEGITKDVNPEYGSIQKLYARDTDLITLCENKAMKILANKDALFNADGSTNVTSNRAVLGQTITYQGEYGIGTNPESFAEFGFRMYFVDSNRGTVIRLSNDGITPVSDYGMHGFFQDNLSINKKIIGSWDADTRNYNVTFNNLTPYWQQTLGAGKTDRLNKDPECGAFVNEYPTYSTTVSFKDDLNGWTSRKTYIPENGISLNNVYYTFKSGKIWEMNSNTSYNNFYGIGPSDVSLGSYYESSFTAIFNESPTSVKDFRTISYSGTDSREYIYKTAATGAKNFSLAQVQAQQLIPTEFSTTKGWYANSIITDLQEGEVKELINKEGKYYNYIKGLPTFFVDDCDNNVDSREFNVQGIGRASAITGNTEITSFTVTNKIDPDCFIELQPFSLVSQMFEVQEDTTGQFQIAENNTACSTGFIYELTSDATSGGSLSVSSTGAISFTPTANYNGSAGSFDVRICCDGSCSSPATMSINVLSVADLPYFTTQVPPLTGLLDGDVWSYNPIGLDDADHTVQQLAIILPQANMPTWMNQPAPLNDGSGNWYIPSSTVSGGAGIIDFTMAVVDPDGNTRTQQVLGDTIEASLLELEFLITTRNPQPARSYTDPITNQVTNMVQTPSSSHGCDRGTYRVVGNTTEIARAYVGNTGGVSYYDTYTVDSDGYATSPTGDVEGSNTTVPSAVAQGTTSTALNSISPYQKYITASDAFNPSRDRYNLITMNQDIVDNIVANTTGPNPEIITFGLISDTYNSGGTLNTHGDGVLMQVFKSGVEIYSAKQPNDSAVTINVLTGEII